MLRGQGDAATAIRQILCHGGCSATRCLERAVVDTLAQFLIDDPDRTIDFGIGDAELM